MVGDDTNRNSWPAHASMTRHALPKFDDFLQSYTQMSDYSRHYEVSFWRRPFAVEAWMRAEGVRAAVVLDSDVVTFADYGRELVPRLPPGCDVALVGRENAGYFSLHVSYWTIDSLADFTSFCIAAYRDGSIRRQLENKYRRMVANGDHGGVSEMTLLKLWSKKNDVDVHNLSPVSQGVAVDLALQTSDNHLENEYEMWRGYKRLTFRHGDVHAFNRLSGQSVRFLAVHCQGRAKPVMQFLCMRMVRYMYPFARQVHEIVVPLRTNVCTILGAARRCLHKRNSWTSGGREAST
jgi:hypothetical protein